MTVAMPNQRWQVTCLTVPGLDTDLSLYVAFDNVRFLFGCGEGTQRALVQKRVSWRGLGGIFIGPSGSSGREGLPGLIMSASDASLRSLGVTGPPDIVHHLTTLRSSVNRPAIRCNVASVPSNNSSDRSDEVYRCPELTVRAVALRNPQASSSSRLSSSAADAALSDRPGDLSGDQLRQWRKNIIAAMFERPEHPESALAGAPEFINFTRPTDRYPLPLPSPEETETDMVYICQAPPVRGKFDNAKAKALNVPVGEIRRDLVQGKTIEFEDKAVKGGRRTVRPEDVVGGGGPGGVLIMVACSSLTMPTLLSSSAFHPYQPLRDGRDGAETTRVHVIIHRIPEAVWNDEGYREWMRAFGDDTQHLIARAEGHSNEICFTSSAWNNLKLSLLDSELFHIPYSTSPQTTIPSQLPPNAAFLQTNHTVCIYPPGKAAVSPRSSRDIAFPSSIDAIQQAQRAFVREMPEYEASCSRAQEAIRADPRWSSGRTGAGDDITVTTLGTGSALPSKYRNVTCIHLDIPGVGSVLLDAGEGSLGQLRRRFGPDGVRHLYGNLRMIFISHMHADHHLGLQRILEDRFKNGITSTLFIVGPYQVALSMQESASWQHGASQAALDAVVFLHSDFPGLRSVPSSRVGQDTEGSEDDMAISDGADKATPSIEDLPLSRDFVEGVRRWPSKDHAGTSEAEDLLNLNNYKRLVEDLGLRAIKTPPMRHRGRAWGLVLEHVSGWKIAYSGDTMPCDNLVRAGRNATLLIHEATLEDDKAEMAQEKGHSTFSQAIEIGKRMNAKHTLLTHFSQRYPKFPKSSSSHVSSDPSKPVVGLAFDLLSVKIGDMWRMSHYMEAIDLLFAEEEDDEGDDAAKAVERDINPTLDAGSNGKERGGNPPKKQRRPNGRPVVPVTNGAVEGSAPKRQSSPSSIAPEKKRTRSDVDMADMGQVFPDNVSQ